MISIAMTTYNGSKYIVKQLSSIFAQTQQADEIIICDDHSTDNTFFLIQNYIQKNNIQNVKVYRNEENLGYIRNFYRAISLTHGDYIFLADQDDEWYADKIEKSIKIMDQTNATALCTASNFIDENSNPIPKDSYIISTFLSNLHVPLAPFSFKNLVLENIAQGCTYCFTREIKDLYLKLNSNRLIHDYQILFIATLVGKTYAYNSPTIAYRLHGNNAAGIQKADKNMRVIWKIPKLKPQMVLFLEDLEKIIPIPHLWFYKTLYYLRIPYFISVIKRKIISNAYGNSERQLVQ